MVKIIERNRHAYNRIGAENPACNCWIFGKRGMTLLAVSTQEVIEAILGSIDEAIHAVDENGITIFYNSVAAKHDGSKIEKVLGNIC